MSINRYKPYVIILPEDRADEEIANGFKLSMNINTRAIQVDKPAGGWLTVVQKFKTELVPEMQKYAACITVMLIDFDCYEGSSHEDRLYKVTGEIPDDLKHRVFVLGVLSEPEKLKTKSKMSFEKIGETLADGCPENKSELWMDELLKHNETELSRILLSVRPFLFCV
ncbi:MAG: hypothetical protein LAC69_10235 [Chlorobium sp.]|jgi:hypothetical protein|nr:hypothetical protein [Chlorobium sp.]